MTYLADANVRWIVVHYTATFTDTEYTPAQLERDHLARGFRETGYHRFTTRDRPGKPARTIECRDLSKPGRFETGAHSLGENDRSVGTCFEGGLVRGNPRGQNTMTPDQEALMIEDIRKLKRRFPNAEVVGHKDMPGAATECPGFDVRSWWAAIERRSRPKPKVVKRWNWFWKLFRKGR